MDTLLIEMQKMSADMASIKKTVEEQEISRNFDNWIPRDKLKSFLNYEDTQLSALLKSGKLKISQIGNRKFIKRDSILKLLEENTK